MPDTDIDQTVRAQLFQLMTGLLPLRDFQVWFAPVAWRLGRPENRDLYPLARRVELRLAEYTRGDWSQQDVLREIGRFLRPDPITMAIGRGDRSVQVGSARGWYPAARTSAGVGS
jgi:hypothetical protein